MRDERQIGRLHWRNASFLSRHKAAILFGVLFAISLAPVLSVRIPAMVDYVNHLARMHVLVDAGRGLSNPGYAVEWRLFPNLALDLIVPILARFLGVEV